MLRSHRRRKPARPAPPMRIKCLPAARKKAHNRNVPHRIAQKLRITQEQIDVLRRRRALLDEAINTLEELQHESAMELIEKIAPPVAKLAAERALKLMQRA